MTTNLANELPRINLAKRRIEAKYADGGWLRGDRFSNRQTVLPYANKEEVQQRVKDRMVGRAYDQSSRAPKTG